METHLPQPSDDAKAHSERLVEHIASEIAEQGPINFARYMQLALYAPGMGYYSAGAHKFGELGDFVTAPELSPLFSRCIARQCGEILRHLGGGDIVELGAGSGVMAATILKRLERHEQLPNRYAILEVSADLRERQQQLLAREVPQLLSRVQWLDRLPDDGIQGVMIGNEVVDAIPTHKFRIDRGLKEFYVDYQNDKFIWQLDAPSSKELDERIASLGIDFGDDYESEINITLPAWVRAISGSLQRGVVILIDYGFPRHEYYHPDRYRGTLMCHYRHHNHCDPLILPGLQDITSHVDFTTLAEAAVAHGLAIAGFTHQAAFLWDCDIASLLPRDVNGLEYFEAAQQMKRLTLPSEMGELFKVMALTRDYDHSLLGFNSVDHRGRL